MNVRREITGKYLLSKHRRYELEHFSLQYDDYRKELKSLDGYRSNSIKEGTNGYSDLYSVEYIAQKRVALSDKIHDIQQAAMDSDSELYSYILKAVTKGMSYTELRMTHNIPCGRDKFYDSIRRYFWLLDKRRK